MDKGDWDEFWEFLREVEKGNKMGAFEKRKDDNDPKSWEEVINQFH